MFKGRLLLTFKFNDAGVALLDDVTLSKEAEGTKLRVPPGVANTVLDIVELYCGIFY
tara:strand:- start:602 stop:772 length:171 start_codon:yes stop_codon:yes gene_type:complete